MKKFFGLFALIAIASNAFAHGDNEAKVSNEWNPKSGIDFCEGKGLQRLLGLVNQQPPMPYKNSDLNVSDWQEISKIKKTWASEVPADQLFDSKVKSIFVYPKENAKDKKLLRSAKVAIEYFNGSKEEITIDSNLFISSNCIQYVYESEAEVPKGSMYKKVAGLYIVPSEMAFFKNSPTISNSQSQNEGAKAKDICECQYQPLNFPIVKASVVCGGIGGVCECSVRAAPPVHQASYLYVMQAKCGGKVSKSEPLAGELGLQVPVPQSKIIKK